MKYECETIVVNPNVANLITSLRDIGYSFEIAVADIIDNSISANSKNIEILAIASPEKIVTILDDGYGMDDSELVEAMRLATQNPLLERSKNDLGRFGLGLKTASFSQCKKLTVISKKNKTINIKQWDLDFISRKNEWLLSTPNLIDFQEVSLLKKLERSESGTLVIWENLDRHEGANFSLEIDYLRSHLSLVFHRFIEGLGSKKLRISINNNPIFPFNPFNIDNIATQQINEEKLRVYEEVVTIQPYILPHHSKTSQQEFERYATEDGYTKSQGFYLYRNNRLLIYGTWWGLHRMSDAHKLVRIKIDINNTQDIYWGIDIKKSTAKPISVIRDDLKRIITQVTEKGSRPFTGRGRIIEDKTTKRFWNIKPELNNISFTLDFQNPIYQQLIRSLDDKTEVLLGFYLKGIQAYLPLDTIQAHLNQNPHLIRQQEIINQEDLNALADILNSMNLDQNTIELLEKTEIFKNHKHLLNSNHE